MEQLMPSASRITVSAALPIAATGGEPASLQRLRAIAGATNREMDHDPGCITVVVNDHHQVIEISTGRTPHSPDQVVMDLQTTVSALDRHAQQHSATFSPNGMINHDRTTAQCVVSIHTDDPSLTQRQIAVLNKLSAPAQAVFNSAPQHPHTAFEVTGHGQATHIVMDATPLIAERVAFLHSLVGDHTACRNTEDILQKHETSVIMNQLFHANKAQIAKMVGQPEPDLVPTPPALMPYIM